MRILLGAEPSASSFQLPQSKNTALMMAAHTGDLNALLIILEHEYTMRAQGARSSIHMKNVVGNTALMVAQHKGHIDCVVLLLQMMPRVHKYMLLYKAVISTTSPPRLQRKIIVITNEYAKQVANSMQSQVDALENELKTLVRDLDLEDGHEEGKVGPKWFYGERKSRNDQVMAWKPRDSPGALWTLMLRLNEIPLFRDDPDRPMVMFVDKDTLRGDPAGSVKLVAIGSECDDLFPLSSEQLDEPRQGSPKPSFGQLQAFLHSTEGTFQTM